MAVLRLMGLGSRAVWQLKGFGRKALPDVPNWWLIWRTLVVCLLGQLEEREQPIPPCRAMGVTFEPCPKGYLELPPASGNVNLRNGINIYTLGGHAKMVSSFFEA